MEKYILYWSFWKIITQTLLYKLGTESEPGVDIFQFENFF